MELKRLVRLSFDRAASRYDAVAALQRRVCDLLATALPEDAPGRILDAGSGTGYGKALLRRRWPDSECIAADFAPAMVAASGGGVCADVEALPFAAAAFDLYWSSLTLQWCNADRTFAEAARVLAPGGRLLLTSLGPGTLVELRSLFAGLDRHRHVLNFVPPERLVMAGRAAGLSEVRVEVRRLTHYAPDLRTLLGELKALGANQIGDGRRPGLMGRGHWRALEAGYEKLRATQGLPITYEVLLCRASKPTS